MTKLQMLTDQRNRISQLIVEIREQITEFQHVADCLVQKSQEIDKEIETMKRECNRPKLPLNATIVSFIK